MEKTAPFTTTAINIQGQASKLNILSIWGQAGMLGNTFQTLRLDDIINRYTMKVDMFCNIDLTVSIG